MRGRLFFLFMIFAAALFGCSSSTGSKEPTARVGDPAPSFTVETIGGKTIRSDDLRGKPLVVTFMAQWCPCSNKSAPIFKEAFGKYSPKGVQFLVLGFQDSRSKFQDFVEKQALPFPAAYDKGDAIGASFGVNAPPTTFFIMPDGRIQRAFYGKIEERATLDGWIDELVEGKMPEAQKAQAKKGTAQKGR